MTVNFADRAHWDALDPTEFGWGGKWDPTKHDGLLVPFTFTSSRGETLNYGKTHKLFAPILREFLTRLDAQAPGALDSDPDEGSFNDRSIRGGGRRSFHSWGIAADTEWRDNPMGVADPHGPHALPDNTGDICRPLGLQWGGLWKSPHDAMHVETHLSPDDCIALARELGHTDPADPLEEVMAMYDSKAEFEAAVVRLAERGARKAVREEGNKGFNVRYLINGNGKRWQSIETYLAGSKAGYVPVAVRAIRAAAAKKAGK